MEDVSNFWPAMAVPITVKIPDPITAPMPSAVSDQGPSVFFSRCSGSSEFAMSLSIDFLAKSWLDRIALRQSFDYATDGPSYEASKLRSYEAVTRCRRR
jgi:hypothetical protein